jgi:hypothetical protein
MTMTAAGLIIDAALEWVTSQVNGALGSNVLTVDDLDGVSVGLAVSGGPKVDLDNLQSGPGGISGRLHIDGLAGSPLSTDLFGDFTVTLTAFDLTLANGGIAAMNIAGALAIPYFTNSDGSAETVDIEVSVRSDGTLAVTLAAQQTGTTSADGLVELHYDLPLDAAIDLTIAALEVDRDTSGVWKVTISGSLALGTGSEPGQDPLAWPSVDLRGLSIDSTGHVSLEGGWIDLPSQAALDFFGFHVALQKLGLGNDQTGRWIGFTGDIHLIEGISLGGSVRGLQINLDTGAVSFTGVGIDFAIPDVISFTGDIEHIHLNPGDDPTTQGLPASFPTPADIFAGGVDINLEVVDLEIQGTFIVANVTIDGANVPCFFLTLDAELPVGIPLFVDVALYGLSGLFATNLYPTVGDDTWWDWFKYPTVNGTPSDVDGSEDYTATEPAKWLNPRPGAFALGAGATIGTQDDGFTASAAIAFMIILPGPVFSIIGRANILSKRIDGPSGPANFDAMATFDGNTGVFDLVIDAQYSIPLVLDIQGSAELYVNPSEGAWFMALGRPPHEKRIQARVLDLFETDAYLVVSDTGLVAGVWIGYQNSWSFGPLSVSIDAYIAGQGAIQWSPFQIAAGVELHGEAHLDAFGIGIGITADALLEATAPNPWWIYGSLSVELDTPWPLPNIGASISLSWGGNDGSVPPAPLALNVVNATLADHGATDRYELLAHRPLATVNVRTSGSPPAHVAYDNPSAPGILAAVPSGYWVGKYPGVATDPSPVVPDLGPDDLASAPLVPQDSHFALTFAHPMVDQAGFLNATAVLPDTAQVSTPAIVGPDDMSNLDLTAPAVQWLISHTLVEVALYLYDDDTDAWDVVAASPQQTAPKSLSGTWVVSDPSTNGAKPMTALRITPSVPALGQDLAAMWPGPPSVRGTDFLDQDLSFSCSAGMTAATVAVGPGGTTGLRFTGRGRVTITFPTSVRLSSIAGVQTGHGGLAPSALQFLDPAGQPLLFAVGAAGADGTFTLTADSSTRPVTAVQLEVGDTPAFLMALSYSTPDLELPLLPAAPGLYALKSVTRVAAGRADSLGQATFQGVTDGDPVIEFAYFQCASGPGTAVLQSGPVGPSGFPSPLPSQLPPQPGLADSAHTPATVFPNGGRLNDLATYTQWAWPGDGDAAAYFGYDVSVEFNETYVVGLYAAFGVDGGGAFTAQRLAGGFPLHFRCVDRNNDHVLLIPVADHVLSVPQQSALVGTGAVPSLPEAIAPAAAPASPGGGASAGVPAGVGSGQGLGRVAEVAKGAQEAQGPPPQPSAATPTVAAIGRARQLLGSARPDLAATHSLETTAVPSAGVSPAATAALQQAVSAAGVPAKAAKLGPILAVQPGLYQDIAQQLAEMEAAATVRALWFRPLQPQTRYTLDVVAGSLFADRERLSLVGGGSGGGLLSVLDQADALATLAALQRFLAREDALTSLQRIQFTTSRYATFSDQLANVGAQIAGTGTTPVRHYPATGDLSAAVWMTQPGHDDSRQTALTSYRTQRAAQAGVVGAFDPLYDETLGQLRSHPEQGSGETALRAQRLITEQAWGVFTGATASTFDTLIAALGRPDLASARKVAPPPATELSLFTTHGDDRVSALLLESPEPIPWRRVWSWVQLQPADGRSVAIPAPVVLWSGDGTRALIVPQGQPFGRYTLSLTFQGNIGAEVACVTQQGTSVNEGVAVGPILLAPYRRLIPGFPHPKPVPEEPLRIAPA